MRSRKTLKIDTLVALKAHSRLERSRHMDPYKTGALKGCALKEKLKIDTRFALKARSRLERSRHMDACKTGALKGCALKENAQDRHTFCAVMRG